MCIQAFELRVSRKGRLLQTWILAVETLVASLPILAVVFSNLVPKTQQHKIKSENSHLTACEALFAASLQEISTPGCKNSRVKAYRSHI